MSGPGLAHHVAYLLALEAQPLDSSALDAEFRVGASGPLPRNYSQGVLGNERSATGLRLHRYRYLGREVCDSAHQADKTLCAEA